MHVNQDWEAAEVHNAGLADWKNGTDKTLHSPSSLYRTVFTLSYPSPSISVVAPRRRNANDQICGRRRRNRSAVSRKFTMARHQNWGHTELTLNENKLCCHVDVNTQFSVMSLFRSLRASCKYHVRHVCPPFNYFGCRGCESVYAPCNIPIYSAFLADVNHFVRFSLPRLRFSFSSLRRPG
jgi:hypothetical protein